MEIQKSFQAVINILVRVLISIQIKAKQKSTDVRIEICQECILNYNLVNHVSDLESLV